MLFTGGYILILVIFMYFWGMGRKLEYSSSIVLVSIGTYMSIGTIPVLLNGVSITMKMVTIFQRVNEVMRTNDKQTNIETEMLNLDQDIVICLKNVTATWGFQIKQDIYSGETEIVTDEPTNNLIDITFDAHKQDFIAVVGPVG